MPFWQLTSEQDWALCEQAQRGMTSSGYRPGPYSTFKEYNVDAFVRWYLHQLVADAQTTSTKSPNVGGVSDADFIQQS
jgi:Rieske 2Fe-2S family protein